MNRRGGFGRWIWLGAALYAVLVCLVVWSMFAARRWALAELSTPAAIGNWEAWREDVRRQQDEPTSVRRRVPKSPEPPAMVVLRDYFAASLTGAVVLSSVLFWIIAGMTIGVLTAEPCGPEEKPAASDGG